MSSVNLCRTIRPLDWLRIRRLYARAFPACERKPFGMILRMRRKGKTDVWVMRREGRFAGFATTINGEGLILIDYLAVPESLRGQGVGGKALRELCDAYPGCGLFVEIESPFVPGDDQPERLRRRAFYEHCGFCPSRTMADVFGVPMELLCHGCTVDFDAYHAFYCTHYGPWTDSRIRPLPYPER